MNIRPTQTLIAKAQRDRRPAQKASEAMIARERTPSSASLLRLQFVANEHSDTLTGEYGQAPPAMVAEQEDARSTFRDNAFSQANIAGVNHHRHKLGESSPEVVGWSSDGNEKAFNVDDVISLSALAQRNRGPAAAFPLCTTGKPSVQRSFWYVLPCAAVTSFGPVSEITPSTLNDSPSNLKQPCPLHTFTLCR